VNRLIDIIKVKNGQFQATYITEANFLVHKILSTENDVKIAKLEDKFVKKGISQEDIDTYKSVCISVGSTKTCEKVERYAPMDGRESLD